MTSPEPRAELQEQWDEMFPLGAVYRISPTALGTTPLVWVHGGTADQPILELWGAPIGLRILLRVVSWEKTQTEPFAHVVVNADDQPHQIMIGANLAAKAGDDDWLAERANLIAYAQDRGHLDPESHSMDWPPKVKV